MTEDVGSQGRFGRIENALNRIESNQDQFDTMISNFRVEVVGRLALLEASAAVSAESRAKRVSEKQYKWMVTSMVATFIIGVGTLVARFVGW